MLTLATRKRLHDIGWTEIHQSDIRRAARCGETQRLSLESASLNKSNGIDSVTALLGTIFHEAVADPANLVRRGQSLQFWYDLMDKELARRSDRQYHNGGKILSLAQLQHMVQDFWSGRIGIGAHHLATMVMTELSTYGWNVTHSELEIQWTDIGEPGEEGYGLYPILFVGTLDMMTENPLLSLKGIMDVKTTGLWGMILGGKGTNAQRWGGDHIGHHRQLRHYDWLNVKANGEAARADVYGLIHPANLVPYRTGPKKGQIRGNSVNLGPVLSRGHLAQYEEDLKRQLSIWSLPWGLGRDYPEIYGKSECPNCRFFKVCVGSESHGVIAPAEVREQYRTTWEG